MSDACSGLTCKAAGCVASCVERRLRCTTPQESNSTPVSYAHEKVQIQIKGLSARQSLATAAVLILALDDVWGAGDDLAQFLTFEEHVGWGNFWYSLS